MEKEEIEGEKVQPAAAVPPKIGFSNWVKWLLGSIVSFLLLLWKNKWDYLFLFKEKAEKVVDEVEVVAKVVEKVATTADKVLEEVANQLPDNSKLKEATQAMEHVSSEVAHDAQFVDNIIDKVDDVKEDLEGLEKMVEPIVDKIKQEEQSRK